MAKVAYEQTEHYSLTRDFLVNRERYLRRLFRAGNVVAGPEPADKRHGALKGALLAVCATALAASAAAACYGLRGWVVSRASRNGCTTFS